MLHGTGMAFYKPDHEGFDVLDVLAGSGAERAGLRPGDRIVEVAGQPARALSVSDVDHLSAFPTHTFLTVLTSDNRRLNLAIGQMLP